MPRQKKQKLMLLDLDDAVLSYVVSKLGVQRRTIMTGARRPWFCFVRRPFACARPDLAALAPRAAVCRRLRELAQASVHTYQVAGQSVMDAIEVAQPGDTVHLLPGCYKEALLIRKPLHLTCDGGRARILSPARFTVFVAGSGCLLENLVLKSHQVWG